MCNSAQSLEQEAACPFCVPTLVAKQKEQDFPFNAGSVLIVS